jgi:formamidopyrimidine-DNA glycosylase
MPELAEVEQSRRIWNVGVGEKVLEVIVPRPQDRVFRDVPVLQLQCGLARKIFLGSESRGKQMLFRFGKRGTLWLGLHLGMAGALRIEPGPFEIRKHDLLVLRQARRRLVFSDRRHLGRVLFDQGETMPAWWAKLPPPILSDAFDRQAVAAFLGRRKSAPLKAVLLMQERFPGIGNWMADEILWRSHLHPAMRGGSLSNRQITTLHRTTRRVCAAAIEAMNEHWEYPVTWLFAHRWEDGGRCPRCRSNLRRAMISGRRTCWCPRCQPLRGGKVMSKQ